MLYNPGKTITKVIPSTDAHLVVPSFPHAPNLNPNLLLHLDGQNTSTLMPDATGRHTVFPRNSAQIDTSQSVFGGASARVNIATSDFIEFGTDAASDFAFGTGDFTIDFRMRFNSIPGLGTANTGVYSTGNNGINETNTIIVDTVDNSINVWRGGVGWIIHTVTVPTTNIWYHVALTRKDGYLRLFQNGVQGGDTFLDTFNWDATNPKLGCNFDGTGWFMDGWLDEVRVIKGTAAWISDFTPPTVPYVVS